MFAAHRATAMVAVVVLAGCGGDSEPAPSPAPTTDPAVTAPPALSPEEQAEAEIQATFEELIAAWDDFKANASDYIEAAADPAWNFELVESEMRMLDEAQLDFLNSTNAFLDSEVEQVGRTTVATISVRDVAFNDDGSATASGDLCLDLSGLRFATYEGDVSDLPADPSPYQNWVFTARFIPSRQGWYITTAEIEAAEVCP